MYYASQPHGRQDQQSMQGSCLTHNGAATLGNEQRPDWELLIPFPVEKREI